MKMLIKDLAGVSKNEALDATAMQSSRELRERVRKLAKQRLGEGPALVQLDALLQRARLATDKRNEFLHSTWGTEENLVVMRDARHKFRKAPTLGELKLAVDDLEEIIWDIVDARLKGFIAQALKGRSSANPQD
jgi:hypothetical protein